MTGHDEKPPRPSAPPVSGTTIEIDSRWIAGEEPAEPDVAVPGDVLEGAYRILRPLGEGGMGVVLLARDERLDRDVALKLLRGSVRRQKDTERLVDEARAMAGVRHENVVQIYSLGEHGGRPFIVMEYVPGSNVYAWLKRFRQKGELPPIDDVLGILDQVCRGVAAIHEAGIVHADLKPGNVLLGPAFRAAVTDFGLVRTRSSQSNVLTIVGTPAYIAPEAVLSEQEALHPAPRRDVYALGVMAFEMLTGRLPVRVRSALDLIATHQSRPPPPRPTFLRPDLPASFDEVLLRAVDPNPERRIQSALELRQALLAAREDARAEGAGMRIVVADDDPDFLALAEESLAHAAPGAVIECVPDGAAAMAALEGRPARLAVIDLDMPGLNGVELTAALRADDRFKDMPIIVVTATGGAPDWKLLSQLGADGFLVKPLDPFALVAVARRTLGMTGTFKKLDEGR